MFLKKVTLITFCIVLSASFSMGQDTTAFFVGETGNLGIGTETPGGILDIEDSDQQIVSFRRYNPSLNIDKRGFSFDVDNDFGDRSIYVDVGNDPANSGAMFFRTHRSAHVADYRFEDYTGEVFHKLNNKGNSWLNAFGGNVGIGTNNPFYSFTVRADNAVGFFKEGKLNMGMGIGFNDNNNITSLFFRDISKTNNSYQTVYMEAEDWYFYTGGNSAVGMRIDKNGSVGIKTATPKAELDVYGKLTFKGTTPPAGNMASISFPSGPIHIRNTAGSGAYPGQGLAVDLPNPGAFEIVQVGLGPVVVIKSDGNSEFNGTISAKKFIVAKASWADHVFKKNFKLKPLEDVEKFISEKKHLPGIPSEEEVYKNGLHIDDMVVKQMQKIEELTLYLIDLKKENKSLKTENKQFEKRLLAIESLVNSIE